MPQAQHMSQENGCLSNLSPSLVAAIAPPSPCLVQAATWAGRGGGRVELGCWGRLLPELGFLASTSLVGCPSSLAPCSSWLQLPGTAMGTQKRWRHALHWLPELQGPLKICRLLCVCELAPYLTNWEWVWDIIAMCGGCVFWEIGGDQGRGE